jgi:type IV pilus assembly protein PilY1
MVFAGANDGMLHAFKLGTLDLTVSGNIKAKLCEDDNNNGICESTETNKGNLGKERWAFIPKGVLPYLQYLADPNYCHLYYVDSTPYVFDASIEAPGQPSSGNYWTTTKTSSSWRTILIGGMRLGGACKNSPATAFEVQTPADSIGYSSYFALDITDPENPQFLWEFSNPNLGFALSGPGVVKINARNSSGSGSTDTSKADKTKDGKWFVVFASGPTGPVGSSQFKGQSDQNLRLFVLDLKTGTLLRTIDTGIANAFGGSMTNASIDYDFDYQDDALYFGYTKSEDATATPSATTKWNKGGVLRLITRANLTGRDVTPTTTAANRGTALNPDNWLVSKVVDDIGAVSASVSHLAHYPLYNMTKPDKAYLYFGTGRFFFPADDVSSGTPLPPQEALYGMLDPCLTKILDITTDPSLSASHSAVCDDSSKVTCTSTGGVKDAPLKDWFDPTSCLENATTSFPANAPNGWYITLDAQAGSIGVERVITDTVASQTGAVFFTSFAPDSDICSHGGATHLWAVKYDTAAAIGGSIKGIGLLQVSTGAIQQIALSSAFGAATDATHKYGRRSDDIGGVPPTGQGLSVIAPPKPIDTMLHIRKK